MPAWPSNGTTNWNTVMKAYVDVGHASDGTHNEAGMVRQVVNTVVTAVDADTNVLIPRDDTIPQNDEGKEFMTLAITPKSATNKLRIDVVLHGAVTTPTGAILTAALFQDTTANALAVGTQLVQTVNANGQVVLTHYMTSGTTSATTFKVRAGMSLGVGTFTFNGTAGGRLYGGTYASSITITEIQV
jgi:hypothetical protein